MSSFNTKELNSNLKELNEVNKFSVDLELPTEGYAEKDYSFSNKIGRCYAYFYNNGSPKIVIGPDYPFYVVLNIIIFIIYIAIQVTNKETLLIVQFVTNSIYIMQFIIYLILFLKNPGIPSINNIKNNNDTEQSILCQECMLYHLKNIKTTHCYECGVCIENQDHHCPWIGKCVGKKTINLFNTFLILTIMVILVFIFHALASN